MQRKLIRASQSVARRHTQVSVRSRPEAERYLGWMKNKTLITLMLSDGTSVPCRIEWYDRNTLYVRREDEVRLLIFKQAIRSIGVESD